MSDDTRDAGLIGKIDHAVDAVHDAVHSAAALLTEATAIPGVGTVIAPAAATSNQVDKLLEAADAVTHPLAHHSEQASGETPTTTATENSELQEHHGIQQTLTSYIDEQVSTGSPTQGNEELDLAAKDALRPSSDVTPQGESKEMSEGAAPPADPGPSQEQTQEPTMGMGV